MDSIDWAALLRGLVAAGMTQKQIAEHCAVGQSTLSDLVTGKSREPRYSTGKKLLALAKLKGVQSASLAAQS